MSKKATLTPAQKEAAKTKTALAKSERFVKLANKRVPKALKAIGLVTNLTSSNYSWTPEQAKAITDAIHVAFTQLDNALAKKAEAVTGGFKL